MILKHPNLRPFIINAFNNLSNFKLQTEKWVNPNYHHAFWNSLLLYSVDTILNDNSLDDMSFHVIGYTVYDDEEAEAIGEYCTYLNDLLDSIGEVQPD